MIKMNIIKSTNKTTNHILLILNMHHIVSDGWSMRIFFKELQLFNTIFFFSLYNTVDSNTIILLTRRNE